MFLVSVDEDSNSNTSLPGKGDDSKMSFKDKKELTEAFRNLLKEKVGNIFTSAFSYKQISRIDKNVVYT